jgi:hypothetical protein
VRLKKILILVVILVFGFISKSQNPIPTDSAFAIKQSIANAPTTLGVTNALQAKKGLINGVFADTTTANVYNTTTGGYRLKFYPGAQIFTTSDNKFWLRNNTATKWLDATSGEGGGSITNLNDSTIIVCNAAGSCDTISLGNSDTYYFITIGDTATALVSCDTVVVTCVGDSCYQTQLCDTTLIPGAIPFPVTFYQNLLWKNDNRVEAGDPLFGSQAQMLHDTYFNLSGGYQLSVVGYAGGRSSFVINQQQWTSLGSSVTKFNHYGAYQPNWPLLDQNNQVGLYVNYTDPFVIPTAGALAGDTVGFMGNEYGYSIMTNSAGETYKYTLDDEDAKQSGIFLSTYSPMGNNVAVRIFGNQVPSRYIFPGNNPTDTTLIDATIMGFRTTGDYFVPDYPNTRNDGVSPSGKGFYADADGNVLYGAIGGSSNSSIVTILNDSTIEVCNESVCDTFDIGTPITNLQNVFVINDTTLLVCNVDNTTCDTVDLASSPAVFDRGFFDPNQASLASTTHNANNNLFYVNNISALWLEADTSEIGKVIDVTHYAQLSHIASAVDADNYIQMQVQGGADATILTVQPTGVRIVDGTQGLGKVFTSDAGGLGSWQVPAGGGSITIINDTTITICSFGDYLCDTFITVTVNPIQYVTIINDSTLQVCDSLGVCDTLNIGTSSPGIDRGFFDPNQISNADTYHQMNGYNFSLGIGLITPPSGYLNMNFLNGNTVSGNENVVFGRNMVVDGNTNFVAATDGTVSNAVNYSATFGDANDQRGTASLLSGFGNDNYVENALVGGNDNVNGALTPGGGTANQYTGSFMIGVNSRSTGSRNGTIGYLVQNTGAQSYIIGSGFGSTRLTNSMGSVIGFGSNSDSITMYVHPAAGTTGSIGKVSIGTSAPTATRLEVVDNAVGAANIVYVSSTSTAAASDVQTGIRVSLSGTNATAGQTTYGAYFLNTHAGTTSETIGARGEASGGTTVNFGLLGVTSSNVGLSAGVYALNTSNGYGLLAETSTSGTAGQGNTASGIGFQGTASSSGIGVRGNSNSGNGVQAYSISGTPLLSFTEHASTNTVVPLIDIYRRSSTTGADGIGASIDIKLETTTTADVLANQIISSYPTATHASRISKLEFTGVTAGATETWLTIGQSGYVKFRPMTVTEAGAIATAEGLMLFVSNTDATFTSVGLWIYQNGAWKAL